MAGKDPNAAQPNMAVRLDPEVKEFLRITALALNRSEKDVACDAINEYCAAHLESITNRLNDLTRRYKGAQSRKKSG